MTLPEIASKLDRAISGGIDTDESKFDNEFLYAKINDARASILREDFIKFKRWNPSCVQMYYPDFEVSYQESLCYTKFHLPQTISGDVISDGVLYLGSRSRANAFRRIKSRTELSDFMRNPRMSKGIKALVENGFVEIYSDETIQTILVEGVFSNPQELPNYNVEKDQYPLSNDLVEQVIVLLMKSEFNQMAATPADTISDSQDMPRNRQIKNG